jgi:hypothetical protein
MTCDGDTAHVRALIFVALLSCTRPRTCSTTASGAFSPGGGVSSERADHPCWRSAILCLPRRVFASHWQTATADAMLTGMDDITPDRYQGVETEAEKQRRLAWEAERIAEARADVIAGRLVDSAKVKAWIDSIGTDHELPVPYSGR